MFFILPVGVDYSARRYPVATFTLMGVNVVLYLVSLLFLFSGGSESYVAYIQAMGLVPRHPAIHTFLTSMFAHAGFFHLLGNMVYLFLFGAPLEDLLGRGRFVAFYLFGGVLAELAHMFVCAGREAGLIPMVGASGAISACLGGFVLLLSKTRINFRYFVFLVVRFWSGDFWLPAWLVISFWFLEDLLSVVLDLAQPDTSGGVAFGAHVGGFLAGMAAMAILKRRLKSPGIDAGLPPRSPRAVAATPRQRDGIHLCENGLALGPFTAAQVSEMRAMGSVSDQALYWQQGMPEWRSILELPG